jgi:hypothetical protein
MSRCSRVPGTPVAALTRAIATLPIRKGELWQLDIHHDDDCSALDSGPMSTCTCAIVEIKGQRGP